LAKRRSKEIRESAESGPDIHDAISHRTMNDIVETPLQSNTSDSVTKEKGMTLLFVYSGDSQVVSKSFDQIFARRLVANFTQLV